MNIEECIRFNQIIINRYLSDYTTGYKKYFIVYKTIGSKGLIL